MLPPVALWTSAALLYGAFFAWYRGFRRPLRHDEVDLLMAALRTQGASPADIDAQRAFFEADDGRAFVMINLIETRETPLPVDGVAPGESSGAVLRRYMAYMWPELLRRACHPVIGGRAVAAALDVWGIEGAQRWTMGALMRYRSRRDLVEIASNEAFRDAHRYKVAAMAKTIAFPIAPFLMPTGGPLVTVALLLLSLTALLQLILWSS